MPPTRLQSVESSSSRSRSLIPTEWLAHDYNTDMSSVDDHAVGECARCESHGRYICSLRDKTEIKYTDATQSLARCTAQASLATYPNNMENTADLETADTRE